MNDNLAHIRYLNSLNNQTVCRAPDMLGKDFIVADLALDHPLEPCVVCRQLVNSHNEKEHRLEKAGLFFAKPSFDYTEKDHRHAAWMIILLISAFWITVGLGIWAVFFA